jgi:hypothetical protein
MSTDLSVTRQREECNESSRFGVRWIGGVAMAALRPTVRSAGPFHECEG